MLHRRCLAPAVLVAVVVAAAPAARADEIFRDGDFAPGSIVEAGVTEFPGQPCAGGQSATLATEDVAGDRNLLITHIFDRSIVARFLTASLSYQPTATPLQEVRFSFDFSGGGTHVVPGFQQGSGGVVSLASQATSAGTRRFTVVITAAQMQGLGLDLSATAPPIRLGFTTANGSAVCDGANATSPFRLDDLEWVVDDVRCGDGELDPGEVCDGTAFCGPDCQPADSDGDGILDQTEGSGDSDGDGLADNVDADDDNDGVPTRVEPRNDGDGDTRPGHLDADRDGDGATDGAEDLDRDGVVDAGEANPDDRDSDDDGLEDGPELAAGLDPRDPNTDDDFEGDVDDADPLDPCVPERLVTACVGFCGNGRVEAGEDCDDADDPADPAGDGDGCSACVVDDGFACAGQPSSCDGQCRNGARDVGESFIDCALPADQNGRGVDVSVAFDLGALAARLDSINAFVVGDGGEIYLNNNNNDVGGAPLARIPVGGVAVDYARAFDPDRFIVDRLGAFGPPGTIITLSDAAIAIALDGTTRTVVAGGLLNANAGVQLADGRLLILPNAAGDVQFVVATNGTVTTQTLVRGGVAVADVVVDLPSGREFLTLVSGDRCSLQERRANGTLQELAVWSVTRTGHCSLGLSDGRQVPAGVYIGNDDGTLHRRALDDVTVDLRTGIAGGNIVFGPDGSLYVRTGARITRTSDSACAACVDGDDDGLVDTEEGPAGTDVDDPDSDDDGALDGAEVAAGSDPNEPCEPSLDAGPCDQDGDGRTNDEELDDGTDPEDEDSDDDGVDDGDERDDGTDPNDADSDDDFSDDGDDVDDADPCVPDVRVPACVDVCGNGRVDGDEECDDADPPGGGGDGDGCSDCVVDVDFACAGAPSACLGTCDNGVADPGESAVDCVVGDAQPVIVVDDVVAVAPTTGTSGGVIRFSVGLDGKLALANFAGGTAPINVVDVDGAVAQQGAFVDPDVVLYDTRGSYGDPRALLIGSSTIVRRVGVDGAVLQSWAVPSNVSILAYDSDGLVIAGGEELRLFKLNVDGTTTAFLDTAGVGLFLEDLVVDDVSGRIFITRVNANFDGAQLFELFRDGSPPASLGLLGDAFHSHSIALSPGTVLPRGLVYERAGVMVVRDLVSDVETPVAVPNGIVEFDAAGAAVVSQPGGALVRVQTPICDACVDSDEDGVFDTDEEAEGTDPDDSDSDDDGVDDGDDPDPSDACEPLDDVGACDRDGDGLDNDEEEEAGTDPDAADSDGDGLVDGADDAPRDPCSPADGEACDLDQDGDGRTSREENEAGTDPLDDDSDGDGVNDGDDGRFDGDGDGVIAALDPDELGPRCGDGVTDCDNEECDDGNVDDGDGCDATCARDGPLTLRWRGPADGDLGFCANLEPGSVILDGDTLVFDADSGDLLVGDDDPQTAVVGALVLDADYDGSVEIGLDDVDGGLPNVVVAGGALRLGPSALGSLTVDGGEVALPDVDLEAALRAGDLDDGVSVAGDVVRALGAGLSGDLLVVAEGIAGVDEVVVDVGASGAVSLDELALLSAGATARLASDVDVARLLFPLGDREGFIAIGGDASNAVVARADDIVALESPSVVGLRLQITGGAGLAARRAFFDGTVNHRVTALRLTGPGAAVLRGELATIDQLTLSDGAVLDAAAADVAVGGLVVDDAVSSLPGASSGFVVDDVLLRGLGGVAPIFGARAGERLGTVQIERGLFVGADDVVITDSLRIFGGGLLAAGAMTLGDDDVDVFGLDVGDTTFDALTFASPRTEIGPRSLLRVRGLWTVRGDSAARKELLGVGGREGEQWSVLPEGGVDVDVVAVRDSLNLREANIDPADFVDLGNNTRWGPPGEGFCGDLLAVDGDVVLDDDAEVRAFNDSGVQCVSGDVVIGAAVTEVVLDNLLLIGGTLRVVGTAVTTLDLSSLQSAGGVVIEGNADLVDVDLDALESVDGDFVVVDNDALESIDLPELVSVGGDLTLSGNDALAELSAPALANVGGDLVIDDNDALDEVSLVVLTSAGSVTITGNAALTALILAALEEIRGDLDVSENDSLEVLGLPALVDVDGDVSVTDNDALESVALSPDIVIGGDLLVDEELLGGTACGDGVVDDGEECDDDNSENGDGCSQACAIEDGFSCGVDRDVCFADADGDGLADADDGCPRAADDGADFDGDGAGDACDSDDDEDGIADDDDDCDDEANAGHACGDVDDDDGDGDGVDDAVDLCADDADVDQSDDDGDGLGDACDDDFDNGPAGDRDGDGVFDEDDGCPGLADDRGDVDGDGLGDGCDSDVDDDGVENGDDVCRRVPDPEQQDGDDDGTGDACDACPALAGDVRGCPDAGEPPPPTEPVDDDDDDDDGPAVAETCSGSGGPPPSFVALLALLGVVALRRRRAATLAVTTTIVALAAVPAAADPRTHIGPGAWSDSSAWLEGAVPGPADDVVINVDSAVTLDVDATVRSLELRGVLGCPAFTTLVVTERVVVTGATAPFCRVDVTGDVVIDARSVRGPIAVSRSGLQRLEVSGDLDELVVRGGLLTNLVLGEGDGIGLLVVEDGLALVPGGRAIDAIVVDGGFLVLDGAVVADSVDVSGGVLSGPGALEVATRLTVSGDGSIANLGDVVVTGADARIATTSTLTAQSLTVEQPGGTVTFAAGTTLRVEQDATLRGALGDPLTLFGEGAGFVLDLVGDVDAAHLAVRGSTLARGRFLEPVGLVDLGENVGWGPGPDACVGLAALRGDVELRTDEEAVAFNDSGVQCVDGDVVFGPDVVFADLVNLQKVTGTIRVRDGRARAIDLGAVVEAGGVDIGGNADLESLDLSELVTVVGDFVLDDNDALEVLELPALITVGGDLVVGGNDALGSISAFALANVGGDLIIDDNDALGSVAFNSLVSVGGDLVISGDEDLVDVDLGAVASVGGDLVVTGNDSLDDLALQSLTSIGGDLFIGDNDALLLLDLRALGTVGGDVLVLDNDVLTALVLQALAQVLGSVSIVQNAGLADVALPVLVVVGGDLVVSDNGDDIDVALPSLANVGGTLILDDVLEPVFPEGTFCDDGGCRPLCGDALLLVGELCDDGGVDDGDGCSARCAFEPGFVCAGSPTLCESDRDGDRVIDVDDLCPRARDGAQLDLDGDVVGDACDGDDDNDGVGDNVDVCPRVPDAAQRDGDGDGVGDACDGGDANEDGDRDGDGVGDDVDLCADDAGVDNLDHDDDGAGDACDDDDDDDGVDDADDPCPLIENEGCVRGDVDGDGVADDDDPCPTSPDNDDVDGDGLGAGCDSDADGDGLVDRTDRCPGVAGIDALDDDDDGAPDACDRCPGVDDRVADDACALPVIDDDDDDDDDSEGGDEGEGCAAAGAPLAPVVLLLGLFRKQVRNRRKSAPLR